jgi:hypothetical protein
MNTNDTNQITATLRLESVTKGAVRYQEVDDKGNDKKMFEPDTLIGTQYIRQGKLKQFRDANGHWPQHLTITITAAEGA